MDQWLSAPGKPIPSGPPMSRSNSTRLVRRSSIIANTGSLAAGLDSLQLPPITAGQVAQFDAAGFEVSAASAAAETGNITNGSTGSSGATGQDGGNTSSSSEAPTFHLVAYPAKDNYEGQLYPLSWIDQVQQQHCSGCLHACMLSLYVQRDTIATAQQGQGGNPVLCSTKGVVVCWLFSCQHH